MAVTAGRLSPEKGHHFLIEAAGLLKETAPQLNFIFCGSGVLMDELKFKSRQLNVDEVCHFIGFRTDIEKIFSIMDFLVLPSLTEVLPNVVLEAFACKKPVVATAVGGVPELVNDNENGFLVASQRPDLLAEKISLMLKSDKLRHKMGLSGFKTVKEHFSFDDQNKRLQELYSQILNE